MVDTKDTLANHAYWGIMGALPKDRDLAESVLRRIHVHHLKEMQAEVRRLYALVAGARIGR